MPVITQGLEIQSGSIISNGLLAHSSDAIFRYRMANPSGFLYVNTAIENLTGFKPEEFYTDPDLHLCAIHPDDLPRFAETMDQPDPSGSLALRWVHTDGRVIPTEVFIRPILVQNGQLHEYEALIRIQPSRPTVLPKEQDVERQVRQFIQASPAAIGIINLEDSSFLEANTAFLNLFGLSREDINGLSMQSSRLWKKPQDFLSLVERTQLGVPCQGEIIQVNRRSTGPAEAVLALELIEFSGSLCLEIIVMDLAGFKKPGKKEPDQYERVAEHDNSWVDHLDTPTRNLSENLVSISLRPSAQGSSAWEALELGSSHGIQPGRARYQRILSEITRSALAATNFDDLLSTTAQQFRDFYQSDGCYISLLDLDGHYLYPAAACGVDEDQYMALMKYPAGGTITEEVLSEKHAKVVFGPDRPKYSLRWLNQIFTTGSILALPLVAGDALCGSVLIVFKSWHDFTTEEVNEGEQAANQIALALAQAHLFHDIQHKFKEIQFLHGAAQAGAEANSLDDLFEKATHLLGDTLFAENYGILLLDPETKALKFHRSFHIQGLDPLFGYPDEREPISQDSLAAVAGLQGVPLRIRERSASPGTASLFPNTHSQLSVPIKFEHTVYGLIHIESNQADSFSAAEEKLVVTFTQQLATAIEKLRLFDEERLRSAEMTAVAEISRDLRNANTRVEMIPVILDQVMKSTPADGAILASWDAVSQTGFIELGVGAWEHQTGEKFGLDDSLCGRILTSGCMVTSGEALSIDQPDPTYSSKTIRSVGGVLLTCETLVTGIIAIGSGVAALREEHLRLLSAIGSITSNAFQRYSLYEETRQFNRSLAESYDATIEGWAHALELRDDETEGHSQRVVDLTIQLARRLDVPEEEIVHIRRGSLLHDIGKMGIPDSIFLKPGPLNEEEWVIMRRHPEYAYKLLSPIRYLRPALDIPHCHHERWDGAGYPNQLSREEIPFSARIFAVVDVWDALTHDRPYREAWSEDLALAYIQKQSDRHFDPQVVEAFVKLIQEGKS